MAARQRIPRSARRRARAAPRPARRHLCRLHRRASLPRELPPTIRPCRRSPSACRNRSGFITTASAACCAAQAMPSLFGNQWFKNLTSLQLGVALLDRHDVFDLPRRYKHVQREAAARVGRHLGLTLSPCDVSVLAQADANTTTDRALAAFLRRPAGDPNAALRLCLTPAMAEMIGTAGPIAIPGGRFVKNPIILTTPQEIHRHVHGLWRSEPLRASHAKGGFIHDIVEQFATLPRLFCDSTGRPAGARAFLLVVGRDDEPDLRQSGHRGSLSPPRDVPRGLHALFPRHRFRRLPPQDGRQRAEGQRLFGDPGLFRTAAFARDRLSVSDLRRPFPVRCVDADALAQEQAGRDRNAAGSAARRDVFQARARDGSDGALDPALRAAEPAMVDLLVRPLRRDRAAHVRISDPRLAGRPLRRHPAARRMDRGAGRSGRGRSHPLSSGGRAVRKYLLEQPTPLRSRIRRPRRRPA